MECTVTTRLTKLRCALPILIAALALGCGKEPTTNSTAEPPKVVCRVATTQTITDYDEFVGRTEAAQSVNIQARVSGFLRSIEFEDGQMVDEDQLLATIEPDEYQAIHDQSIARIELSKAKLDLAESELARAMKLAKSQAISKEELEQRVSATKQAKSEVVVAEADAARSALDLKYTEIRSPIKGRIDRAFITEGNMLTGGLGAGTLLTRVVQSSPMYANFNVDEQSMLSYVRRAKKEQSSEQSVAHSDSEAATTLPEQTLKEMQIPCLLQLQDETGFPHEGLLDFASTEVDMDTGTIVLRGVFDNQEGLFQSGMFVRVRIPTSDAYEAVLIPEIAIGTDLSYKFAFVVNEDDQAERRTITLGESLGQLRVVKSGIKAGERVIARGVQRVRPNMKVRAEMESNPSLNPGSEPESEDAS